MSLLDKYPAEVIDLVVVRHSDRYCKHRSRKWFLSASGTTKESMHLPCVLGSVHYLGQPKFSGHVFFSSLNIFCQYPSKQNLDIP